MSKKFRYHCRFKWEGVLRYGIVQQYGEEAEEAARQGKVLIACAVGPDTFFVAENDVTDLDCDYKSMKMLNCGVFFGMSEVDDYVSLANIAHRIREARLPNDGKLHVGHQFSIGVADGSANYVVTKVMKKFCYVEFRSWCADRWTDHHFGLGGRFSIAEISHYVKIGKSFPNKLDAEKTLANLKEQFRKKYGNLPESLFIAV